MAVTDRPRRATGRRRKLLAVIVPWLLASCSFYGDPCQKQIAECLARCDRADHGGEHVDTMPRDERSACERNCHRCAPPAGSSGDPAPAPTPTGLE